MPETFQDILDMDYNIKFLETSENDRTPVEGLGQIMQKATIDSNPLYFNLWQRYLQDYSNKKAKRIKGWGDFLAYYQTEYLGNQSKLAVLNTVTTFKYSANHFIERKLTKSSILIFSRQGIMLFRKSFVYLMEFNQQ